MTQNAAIASSTNGDTRRRNAFIMVAHDPATDPRIEWISELLDRAGYDVCQIGFYRWHTVGGGPSFEQVSESCTRVRLERTMHDAEPATAINSLNFDVAAELSPLLILDTISRRSAEQIGQIAALTTESDQTERFQALCGRFFDTNMALARAARLIGAPDLIVSVGLEALPGGIIAGRRFGSPVIYDAHEFSPFSTSGMTKWESEIWCAFEKRYAAMADRRVAVSPHLARGMTQFYGLVFETASNAVPLSHGDFDASWPRTRLHKDKVVFLFHGNFAVEGGLEELVSAWPDTDAACVLYLRGPDQPFKKVVMALAEATGLLNKRIFFPQAVDERNSVRASLQADVGLAPYQALSLGSRYCCPNELSHYMAAGLPIISNKLDFVSEAVEYAQCGQTVDFNDSSALVTLINAFATDRNLRESYGRNARSYFESTFNWERQSANLLSWVRSLAAVAPRVEGNLDFGWIENQTAMRRKSARHRAPLVADVESIRGRDYDDLRSEFDHQVAELRRKLEDRERVLGELKTVSGIGRYGYRFVRRRVLRLQCLACVCWRLKSNVQECGRRVRSCKRGQSNKLKAPRVSSQPW